jgi:hypothetical protein
MSAAMGCNGMYCSYCLVSYISDFTIQIPWDDCTGIPVYTEFLSHSISSLRLYEYVYFLSFAWHLYFWIYRCRRGYYFCIIITTNNSSINSVVLVVVVVVVIQTHLNF